MDIVVRPVTDAEYGAYGRSIALSFGVDYEEEKQAHEREMIPVEDTLAAFEDGKLVGTEGAFRMTLAIPGGQVPMVGVTSIGVRPTHHRRGILTAMMRARLEGMRERGEWLAGLWASESGIYGRFGYGVATEHVGLEIDTAGTDFERRQVDPGSVRLVDPDEARNLLPSIYDRAAADWPGVAGRDGGWWRHILRDPREERRGNSALMFAVHSADGEDDGYAIYRTKLDCGRSEAQLEDLMTSGDLAYASLWRYLMDIDLMSRLVARRRPVDEPLPWMLRDRGRVRQTSRAEGLWLRLVDIPRALATRTYPEEGRVVFEVVDEFCPWNIGRHLLAAAPGGATCAPTTEAADISIGPAALAAAYLGGVSLFTLARVGRVGEEMAGAVRRAGALFRWHRAPWSDRIF